jgi:hypothetical protein
MRQQVAGQPSARYADSMASADEPARSQELGGSEAVRDPLAMTDAVRAARERPMSERLELALSWNSVAAELRAGLLALTGRANASR